MDHVAEYSKEILQSFLSGDKTVDFRVCREPRVPFKAVCENDTIYLKMRDGFTVAKAKVTKVENYSDMSPEQLKELVEKYQNEIKPTRKNLDSDIFNRYATFIWIGELQEIRPFKIRNDDQQHTSWRTVENIVKILG